MERIASRRYLLPALLALAAVLVWQASELWIADYRMNTARPDEMQRSAALVPGDGEAWDRLGRYYLLNFSSPNISLASRDFERAVKVDPLREDYWMDLASAYDASGNEAGAEAAYGRAHEVYPRSAMVDWNYGNFLLREGKQAQALEEIRRAVAGNPDLLTLAISRVWHSSPDVNQLIDGVLPQDVNAYLVALDFFSARDQADAGLAVWKSLVGLKRPIVLARTYGFLNLLLRNDDTADALRVWNEAVAAAGEPGLAVQGDSLVSDGHFENPFPKGGLGWNWQTQNGAEIDFDPSLPDGKGPDGKGPDGKARSIRLDFNGAVNLNIAEPLENVAVEPGRTYHFHAAMRTDQISTDSGMRFLIDDARHGGLNIQTAEFTGTHPWTNVDADIKTLPSTHFLMIELFRPPSRRFDNKLRGSVWVANVSLVPVQAEAGEPRP